MPATDVDPAAHEGERAPLQSLQITFRDLVGQNFNGFRLHQELKRRGHVSRMLVVDKQSADPDVHTFSGAGAVLERALYGAERVSSLQGLLSPLALTFPMRRCFREARVVHWHLVYTHLIAIPWVPFAARLRPTVWTIHDPWITTGHCVHPLDCERWRSGCGRCPDLARNFTVWFDTTSLVWRAKRAAYRRAPLQLIVASQWMKDRVQASPLLASFPCHLIPFGLDLEVWRIRDRAECRARLGIPADAKVIAFRVPGGAKHRIAKGIPALIEALHRIEPRHPMWLLALDDRGQLSELSSKYRILELGWLAPAPLAEALAAADLFVMPSLAESFGLMALEALACGTPVIGTTGTAVADTIRPPLAGLTVPARNGEALAESIRRLLEDDPGRAAMGRAGRAMVESEYSLDRYVRSHEDLYSALGRTRRRGEAG